MARSIRALWLGVSFRTATGSCCFFAPKCRKREAAEAERDVAAKRARARLAVVYFRKIIVCDSRDAPGAIMALRAESNRCRLENWLSHTATYKYTTATVGVQNNYAKVLLCVYENYNGPQLLLTVTQMEEADRY
jgi:hypothetical protein